MNITQHLHQKKKKKINIFLVYVKNAITIKEAKYSIAIENIVTIHDSIYKVLNESDFKEETVKEVLSEF